LRDQLLNILLAGRDTTSSLLSSVFYFLARDKRVWVTLRKEILGRFGNGVEKGADINFQSMKDLPYLRYVINEGKSIMDDFRIKEKQDLVSDLSQHCDCFLQFQPTPVVPSRTQVSLSAVVRTVDPRFSSRRAPASDIPCGHFTDALISGVLTPMNFALRDGLSSPPRDGSICPSTEDPVSALDVRSSPFSQWIYTIY
jgi:hypothetical protein